MRKQVFKTIAKIILAMTMIMSCEFTSAQKICFCYKGAWSDWSPRVYGIYSSQESLVEDLISNFKFYYGDIYGASDYSGFSLKKNGVEYFKFTIDYPFQIAPKKVRKEHLKTGEWYVYSGTVEYYVNDVYPTAQDLAKRNYLFKPDPRSNSTPYVKRICKDATIKIAPYKKRPECFNIWFDGIGVGIDIKYLDFQ